MKVKIKYLTGFVFYYSGLVNLIHCFRKRALKKGSFTILTYHRISDSDYGDPFLTITPHNFERQIRYLTKRFKVVSLEELVKHIQSQYSTLDDYIAITFDDGYRDNYTNAYPILKKYKVPATIFLTTDFIGTDKLFWWDRLAKIAKFIIGKNLHLNFPQDLYPKKIKDAISMISSGNIAKSNKEVSILPVLLKEISEEKKCLILDDLEKQISPFPIDDQDRPYPLTWDEVRQMNKDDIEFGSHTVTHPILTRVKSDQAKYEISQSKIEIEREIAKKVLHFSYPNGERADFDEHIKQLVKDNNYISACTSINGANGLQDDVFSLKRRAIDNSPVYVFAWKITGIPYF